MIPTDRTIWNQFSTGTCSRFPSLLVQSHLKASVYNCVRRKHCCYSVSNGDYCAHSLTVPSSRHSWCFTQLFIWKMTKEWKKTQLVLYWESQSLIGCQMSVSSISFLPGHLVGLFFFTPNKELIFSFFVSLTLIKENQTFMLTDSLTALCESSHLSNTFSHTSHNLFLPLRLSRCALNTPKFYQLITCIHTFSSKRKVVEAKHYFLHLACQVKTQLSLSICVSRWLRVKDE